MTLSNAKPQRISKDLIENDVSKFLNGNENAFLSIKDHVEPVLNHVLRSRCKNLCKAKQEDVKQELWIEFIQKIHQWDPERGSLKSFVFWCLRNRLSTLADQESKYSQRFYFTDQLESFSPTENENPFFELDLDIHIETRITGPLIHYVLRKVAVAVYHKNFERNKSVIIKDLCQMTDVAPNRITFFVDYALVIIRRHCLENEWKLKHQNLA